MTTRRHSGRHSTSTRRSSIDLRRGRRHRPALWEELDDAGMTAFQRLTWFVLGCAAIGGLAGLGWLHLGAAGATAGAAVGVVLTGLACMI